MEGEIIFNIDVMLAKRKMSVTELSLRVGITMANISILKSRYPRLQSYVKHLTVSREICWNIEIALAIMEKI